MYRPVPVYVIGLLPEQLHVHFAEGYTESKVGRKARYGAFRGGLTGDGSDCERRTSGTLDPSMKGVGDVHLLFICTGNTCRSPMAAFFARHEIHQRGLNWSVESAGLYAAPGQPMSAFAADALTRRQIPLQDHASQPVTEELVQWADVILVMTASHAQDLERRFPAAKGKTALLGRFLADDPSNEQVECDIVDPFGGSDREYEDCARDLQNAVSRLIDYLEAKGGVI